MPLVPWDRLASVEFLDQLVLLEGLGHQELLDSLVPQGHLELLGLLVDLVLLALLVAPDYPEVLAQLEHPDDKDWLEILERQGYLDRLVPPDFQVIVVVWEQRVQPELVEQLVALEQLV